MALLGVVLSSAAKTAETEYFEILSMATGGNVKRLNLYPSIDYPNPAGCVVDGWLQADETIANLDHIIAMTISAYHSKSKVYVHIDDNTCAKNGTPLVFKIYVGEI